MSFINNNEHRASSVHNFNGEHEAGASFMPELATQQPPVEQLPFPGSSSLSGTNPQEAQQYPYAPALSMTRALEGPTTSPGILHELPEMPITALTVAKNNTTTLRPPVIIHGSGKKSTGIMRPPKGPKTVVGIATSALLALIILSALVAVVPVGSQASGNGGFNLFRSMGFFSAKGNNTSGLIASQIATATAVTQDGYDPGAGKVYAGVPAAPAGAGAAGDHFFYGQCTDWAAKRYHALTGIWVPWLGNANQWYAGALSFGWNTSTAPHLHSIIVLQANVQGAGYYGHVAIVEQINADGSVLTSNYNWAGNWAVTTYVTFRPGAGVNFVWAPGF